MSGAHHNKGKVRMTLVDAFATWAVAKVMTDAAEVGKYGMHNWRLGLSWMEQADSLIRHINDWRQGIDIDPESKNPTLWHVGARAMMLIALEKYCPWFDDRPCKLTREELNMNPTQLRKHFEQKSPNFQRNLHEEERIEDVRSTIQPVSVALPTWIRRESDTDFRCERCESFFKGSDESVSTHRLCANGTNESRRLTEVTCSERLADKS